MLDLDFCKTLGRFHLKIQLHADNEAVALLGASGSGKSLTLKCIAGVEKPDSGRIILDGETLFDSARRIHLAPQKRGVGLLFQNYALFPSMTVQQNIMAGLRHVKPAGRAARCAQMIEQFHLSGLAHRLPHQLSGGQQQRVALARMLAAQPRLLLLDEPFSALDSFLRWQLEQVVSEVVSAHGGTTLFVSHNRDEAYRLCDRIAVVSRGRVEAAGEKNALFHRPETRAAAMLTGCKNIAAAQPAEAHAVFVPDWNLSLTADQPVDNTLCAVGLRAHFFAQGGAENAFSCTVERVIQSPFSAIVMVRPLNARACLQWECAKEEGAALSPGQTLRLSIAPAHVLLLRDQ